MIEQQTAFLIGSYCVNRGVTKVSCEENLDELERLGETFGLKTIRKFACSIQTYDAAHLIGSGKLEEIRLAAAEANATTIIFDDEISPRQQTNLEKILERPVIDRTELILGVFAQRAQTREAKLQVELAEVRYQMPRLKRLWTHLSRQRTGGSGKGGGGYLKGEGEKQIELDRRILQREIDQLQKELEQVRRIRMTQRQARKRSAIPTFALVGYTNAGKSTLLKALTGAEVLIEDKLFATLDTTTRKFELPNQQSILITDTVGFIRKLPHLLVAAFRGTLEEAVHTDILIHVIDASHPRALAQAEATLAVLKELEATDRPIITVLNKNDQCTDRFMPQKLRILYPKTVEISALHRTGFDALLEMMVREIAALRMSVTLRIPQSRYDLVSEIMREGRITSCEYEGDEILIEAEIPQRLESKVAPFTRLLA